MNSVSKSELKAKMLEYLRQVEQTGEELVITDNRKPVLKVVPIKSGSKVNDVFDKHRTKIGKVSDVLAPLTDEWELD